MVKVVATSEFEEWFLALDQKDGRAVARVVGLLEMKGVSLGFPYSSAIEGSRHALRELRVQSGGHPLRVFYLFDPDRQAVLLIGGDKTNDKRFYQTMIPTAETIWQQYLLDRGVGGER
ncbi:MAG: addiction module toxin RelE [Thermoanaerobaculia bacterium]|nr:addiction module toxin RelE [Thermoanaerobaculia bacterium]